MRHRSTCLLALALLAGASARAQPGGTGPADRVDLEPGLRFIVASSTPLDGWTAVRVLAGGDTAWLGPDVMRVGPGGLDSVHVALDSLLGGARLRLSLGAEATAGFAKFTTAALERPVAVVVDGVVLLAPVVREPIAGGQIEVSGLSALEAEAAAAALRPLLHFRE